MLLLYIIIGICIFFQAERGIFDSISLNRLFKKLIHQRSLDKINILPKKVIWIIIPLYEEQAVIENTLEKMCLLREGSFEIQIAVVTSVKEKLLLNRRTTEEVIVESLELGKLSKWREKIHVFQDLNLKGNMATQLNYAIEKIRFDFSFDEFYFIYNSDSEISDSTFSEFSKLLLKENKKEFVFQQPCAYIKTTGPLASNFVNALSVYQSWYCLAHESRIIGSYEKKYKKSSELGIVTGHGSGMTLKINKTNGGYPEDFLTEDLTFGFFLSACRIPILLLPALEVADVPTTFVSFVRQRSVWFWNYIGYVACFKKMRNKGVSLVLLSSLVMKGLGRGLYWLFSSLFFITPIFFGLIMHSSFLLISSVVSFIVFIVIPQYFLLKKLPQVLESQGFMDIKNNIEKVNFFSIFPALCLIIFTDSVGPWIGLFQALNYLITKKLPQKYKTIHS
ncbi:glycosyltransferase family 2 protein [Patescibacteria group bacterium]|nr:glycosyltransferase family 2 protein [Patescibacteria group bacterium]